MINKLQSDGAVKILFQIKDIKKNFDSYLEMLNQFNEKEKELINLLPSKGGFELLSYSPYNDYKRFVDNKYDLMIDYIYYFKKENKLSFKLPDTKDSTYDMYLIQILKSMISSKKLYEFGLKENKIKHKREKLKWQEKQLELQTLLQNCVTDYWKHLPNWQLENLTEKMLSL